MAGARSRYILTTDEQDPSRLVELWSEARLPFEPSPPLKDMRNALRTAVRRLRARDGGLLQATYESLDASYCDLENVLFYNVGTGSFSAATRTGVRFDRAYTLSNPTVKLDWVSRHHHRYEIARADAPWRHWREVETLAQWTAVRMPSVSESTSASAIWHAMLPWTSEANADVLPKPFGIRLTVRIPRESIVNACAIAKPLLDGAISACHSHDGTDVDEIALRLGARLHARSEDITERLMSSTGAVLGRRRLLYLRAAGVQWNPADDQCVAGQISIDSTGDRTDSWVVSGKLLSVVPA